MEKIVSMASAIRELKGTNSLIPTWDDVVAALKLYNTVRNYSKNTETFYR